MNIGLIIVGVVVIFLAIGITFFFLRNGIPGAGSKDDRPLLTLLSMSDSSEGTFQILKVYRSTIYLSMIPVSIHSSRLFEAKSWIWNQFEHQYDRRRTCIV